MQFTDADSQAVHGELQLSTYCNDWHSCCGAVELGPCVEVLLDLPGHRQLVLILWHTIILENTAAFSISTCCIFTQRFFVHGWSGQTADFKTLNSHWPRGDRAPAQLCISHSPPPAASQWSKPTETWRVSCERSAQQITVRLWVFHMERNHCRREEIFQTQTLAVSDTLSQYGVGKSSRPLKICSKRASWSSPLLHNKTTRILESSHFIVRQQIFSKTYSNYNK